MSLQKEMLNGAMKKYFESNKTEINVISKEEFEDHVERVAYLLWETLSKSFGPYGSNTIIHRHPYSHITKDGFTIAKSLSFNVKDTFTNQAIATMFTDICGRMNTTVGDGTTTAIVATYNIYKAYVEVRSSLLDRGFLPRDLLYRSEYLKDQIRSALKEMAVRIDVPMEGKTTEESIVENIRKVVSVSSNGDESITNTITSLYQKFGYPLITCEKSIDGEERVHEVEGFRLPLNITDQMYVNSDDGLMRLEEADVLVFTCKITNDIYEHIIRPTLLLSQTCGRKLLIAAPSYDEVLLDRTVAPMLRNEYSKYKSISLVLCSYKATNAFQRKTISDFAMLCRTTPIDRPLASEIIQTTTDFGVDGNGKVPYYGILNTRREWLPEISYPFIDVSGGKVGIANHDADDEKMYALLVDRGAYIPGGETDHKLYFNLGYCKDLELGLNKPSIIHKFFYDEDEYQLHVQEAKKEMESTEAKYKRLGTFNTETTRMRQRYYALQLQIALIEVGGDSDLSIGMRQDIYDDAIKAAASAYRYGIIQGCNVSTIQAINRVIYEMQLTETDPTKVDQHDLDLILLGIIKNGFVNTYRTVLSNWMADIPIWDMNETVDQNWEPDDTLYEMLRQAYVNLFKRWCKKELNDYFTEEEFRSILLATVRTKYLFDPLFPRKYEKGKYVLTFFDLLIKASELTGMVFDLTTKEFNDTIVNSLQTDDEILNATIDLLTLLMSGNQMVVTQRLSFEE